MALEILSSRILAPRFGNSVYVWGSIISVFLAALSVGYWWGGRAA
ncbi:MAG TPA: fused MFS/spermidine synthase, partial [Thermoanaerobaculia bacterium]|nr:fused MFS/spermidine synthase [Thermoanaerobaculia bacterium]